MSGSKNSFLPGYEERGVVMLCPYQITRTLWTMEVVSISTYDMA